MPIPASFTWGASFLLAVGAGPVHAAAKVEQPPVGVGAATARAAPLASDVGTAPSVPPGEHRVTEFSLDELLTISLDELLNLETGVATKTATRLRESPAIITIITREEILNMGARDLIDVLGQVPGFHFGVDVQSTIGLGVRGAWGHEGKVLLLFDGQTMNEGLFLTTQFGNHYPVANIERIEIVRGPGSVIYGGYAELAVINIITRKGAGLQQVYVSGAYGQSVRSGAAPAEQGFLRRNLSFGYGQQLTNGLDLSLAGTVGQGNESDYYYRDIYGGSYRLNEGQAKVDPRFFNFGATWKGVQTRFIFDDYRTTERDAFDAVMSQAAPQGFRGIYAEVAYDYAATADLKITPRLNLRQQRPWYTPAKDPEWVGVGVYLAKNVTRGTGSLTLSYNPPVEGLNVLLGGEVYREQGKVLDYATPATLFVDAQGDRVTEISYDNYAGFLQVLWANLYVNASAGARYEKHSRYGDSFVPRLGLTKVMDRVHAKLLYSQAFKAPGLENIRLNPDITSERTQVFEVEAGYEINDQMFAAINLFDIRIEDPIIFTVTSSAENYTNQARTSTRGAEIEYRYRGSRGYATVSYSFYTAAGRDQPFNYAAVQDSTCTDDDGLTARPDCLQSDAVLLGMPSHKIALNGSVRLVEGLTVNPSAVAMSKRYGYMRIGEGGEALVDAEDPTLLLNVFVRYQSPAMRGLSVGVGLYNILGEKFRYLQPYDGWHAPFPGAGREVMLQLDYGYSLD